MSPATTLDSFCRRVHSFTRALRMNIMARCQRGIGECACVCKNDAVVENAAGEALGQVLENAASEDRTHDLRIMRPTRCQLRYRRPC